MKYNKIVHQMISSIMTDCSPTTEQKMIAPARILIVEDESIVALDISRQLKRFGHTVVGILADGESVIDSVANIQPDLILMDIRLKGVLDGIDAAQAVRQHSPVPIIFLSAYADPATLERAEAIGISDYLIKPFKDTDLQLIVDNVIRNARRS